MNNIEILLSQKIARKNLLQSQKRALLDEYMPIKEELETVEEEIEQLEGVLQKKDDVQTDARFDELIEGTYQHDVKKHDDMLQKKADGARQEWLDDGVKTIEENEAIEMETLIDEIKNPEDYTNFDLTQHQE